MEQRFRELRRFEVSMHADSRVGAPSEAEGFLCTCLVQRLALCVEWCWWATSVAGEGPPAGDIAAGAAAGQVPYIRSNAEGGEN